MALTTQQKKLRATGIGGSDVAAIFGISPWATPLDIYNSKTCKEFIDDEPDVRAEWGNRLEPVILKAFEEKSGCKVVSMEETFGISKEQVLRHPEFPFMLANIDGFIPEEKAVLEIKTADKYMAQYWGEAEDGIPESYLLQCAHYRIVCDAILPPVDKVYSAVLIGGNDFRIKKYEKNEKLERLIIEKEYSFWNEYVVPMKMPPPLTLKDMQNYWKTEDKATLVAGEREWELYFRLMNDKKHLKTLSEYVEQSEKTLKMLLQANEALVDDKGRTLLTWKSQTANRLDIDRLKKDHPDLVKDYMKVTEGRVFRTREVEELKGLESHL